VPGANDLLQPQDLPADWGDDAVVLVQNEVPSAVTYHVILAASRRGATVIWNPAPAPAELPPAGVLAGVSFLIVNESELAAISGYAKPGCHRLDEHADCLVTYGVRQLVVTLGDAGALLVTPGGRRSLPVPPVDAEDAVGAGDCFAGTFTARIAAGKSPLAAAARAVAAASLSVTRHGAQPSMPTAQEVDRYLESVDTPLRGCL